MKVLLVNPAKEQQFKDAYAAFPNGLLFLAAVLEKNGHTVSIYDANIDKRKPEDFIVSEPELIGFSVLTGPCIADSITQSQTFKRLLPKAKIVWGNVHPSVTSEQVIAEPFIDYVIVGAGEYTLLELVDYLGANGSDINSIKGLVHKEQGVVTTNESRPFIDDLNELPDPAWHLVDVKKYWAISLNTSRGCPFRCSFCYNKPYYNGYRGEFSAERIISQVKHLKKTYGVKYIRFWEDNFTADRRRLREFCRLLIAEKLKLKWDCEARADLNESDIELMARSGCVAVGLGVETGSQRLLGFLEKDIALARIEKTYWQLLANKIIPNLYIMEALPSETIDDFRMTQEFLNRLDEPPYIYRRYVPSPGTKLFQYCVEKNLIKPPSSLSDWVTLSTEAPLSMNLSNVPTPVIDRSFSNYAETYVQRRLRFTLHHNPSYFLKLISNPLEFFRALRSLFKCSSICSHPILENQTNSPVFEGNQIKPVGVSI